MYDINVGAAHILLSHLLSLPGCCCISSSLYFLANNMNPFMGRFGLSGSLAVFFAGDMGGDMMEPVTAVERTAAGSRLAIPWRRLKLESRADRPGLPAVPGENCSARSTLRSKKP